MASLITVYWRDIPVQVMARRGRKTSKQGLSNRFMKAVDRAAMRARKTDADAYLSEWRRVSEEYTGDDLEQELLLEAKKLEESYSNEDLDRLARAGGLNSASE